MIEVPLLLLQIFSQDVTPTTPGKCVAVTYRGTTYKAANVRKYRFTGRVIAQMKDRYVGPSLVFGSLNCDTRCNEEAAQRKKEARLRENEVRLRECMASASTDYDKERCRTLYGVADDPFGLADWDPFAKPDPECLRRCQQEVDAENKRIRNLPATPPIPGRQIELSGYDSIANDSSCLCDIGASRCIDR